MRRLTSLAAVTAGAAALLLAPSPAQAAGACGPLDVAFVLDNSISMSDGLTALRQDAASLTGDVAALSGGDYRMGLVSFRNQLLTVRSPLVPGNQSAMTSLLGGLWQESGGGQAHASDEALNTAVNLLPARPNQTDGFTVPWRDNAVKVVLLVTNAPPGGFNGVYLDPRDPDNAHQRAVDAVEHGVKISSVYVQTASLYSVESQRIMNDYAATTGGTFSAALGNGLDLVGQLRAALAGCEQSEITIRDDPADTGAEPNPGATTWSSPDIAVCPTTTPCTGGSPRAGADQYVFVRLNNLGPRVGVGTVELYSTQQGGAAFWPTSWRLVGKAVGVTAGTGGGQVLVPWPKVPAGGHGLLARWVSASDPMTFAEGPDTATNARNDNNIAWRSVTSVDQESLIQKYVVTNPYRKLLVTGLQFSRAPKGTVVDLGQDLFARWQESGARGSGIERTGKTSVLVVDPKVARIAELRLGPEEMADLTVTFPQTKAVTRISQTDAKGGDLGGTEFRVLTD
jgi:von Willebrand factor type A domain-containing protein